MKKRKERSNPSKPLEIHTPIVGIGASAGGLAAFEAFFSGMPKDADPDMAFVLIQHLDPNHKSILTEIIGRATRMQVFEVEDGMPVHPNCVYIIPPNRDMALMDGSLQLMEPSAPRGHRMPIDFFFRSLAHDQHEKAICVILSGTGSDGTLGAREVKGEGGMVMVQHPASAQYDGMLRSLLSTGLVDFELPPAEMPAQLIAYANHAFKSPPRVRSPSISPPEQALNKVFVLLRVGTSHDFSQYKPSTILRRIERRMAVHQIAEIDGYVQYLQQSTQEVEALFRDLLIGVTSFFRDKEAFQALEQQAIPKLFDQKKADDTLRIWCPGCSTGEEAYSIAILIREYMESKRSNVRIQIFATDIDSLAIATARTGEYPASIALDMTSGRLARFFHVEPDQTCYRVIKSIRDMLVFSEQNVIKDPPFSRLDLISCRNLMIYLNGELQKKLIPLFHYALNPSGFLFLGTSETIGSFETLYGVIDRKAHLFQRKEMIQTPSFILSGPLTVADSSESISNGIASESPRIFAKKSVRETTEQALLRQLDHAALLVDGSGDIQYIHGRTGSYLELSPGEQGINNILKMSREGLKQRLAIALHKVATTGEIVKQKSLPTQKNGDVCSVDLMVCPVDINPKERPDRPLFLVVLNPSDQGPPVDEATETAHPAKELNSQILALREELRTREEYLQSTNEELETANEELKSSNEEMQSVNEELQSTNEELETSKEELQSLNEELATVNSELQAKVADLTRTNNDLNNLVAGTGIGTVFLDLHLRILRFTPSASRIINLIASDVGRPVAHIVSNLIDYENLITDTQTVLDTLIPKEREVQTQMGNWYLMRILPYRTFENAIEGAVLTFVEITQTKKIQDALKINEQRMRVAMVSSGLILFNQDLQLRYSWVDNLPDACSKDSFIGKTDADILSQTDAEKLIELKKGVLESGKGIKQSVQIHWDNQPVCIALTLEPLRDDLGRMTGITGAISNLKEK